MFDMRLLKSLSLATLVFFAWFTITADFTFAGLHAGSLQGKDKADEISMEAAQDGVKIQEEEKSINRTDIIYKEKKKKKISAWWFIGGGIVVGIVLYLILKKKEPVNGDVNYDTEVLGFEWVDIPEGRFLMGDNLNEGDENERPAHEVYLSRYSISKYEVTFAQYDRYCEETGAEKPQDAWGRGNHPVINVSWDDASAFCRWLSNKTGKNFDLPTEAQWEKAARGTDGRKYPWGNDPPTCDLANYNGCHQRTVEVGSEPYSSVSSPYGARHMAGNVWEWCRDLYDSGYYSISPDEDPTGPSDGNTRVIRGGGYSSDAYNIRTTRRFYRYPSGTKERFIGFRICRNYQVQ